MNATHPVVETWAKLAMAATWQLMALALLALACEWVLQARHPRVRYALWCAALACPLLLAPVRLCMTGRQFVVSLPKPVSVAAKIWGTAAPSQTLLAPAPSGDLTPPHPATGLRLRWPAADLSTKLALAWLLGCAALAVRLAVGYGRLRRLVQESTPVTDATALESLRALCNEAGIRGPVDLRSSVRIPTATVCGVWSPIIIIARDWLAELKRDELRALLAHEVAHVRQRDFLANLLQRAAEGCLFFHPATWLASRRITLAREEVCDAWALGQGGGHASYARSLVAAAERAGARLTVVSVGIAESRSTLLRRVEVIMKGNAAGRSSRLAGIVPAALMLAVATALVLAQIGTRQAMAQGGGGGGGGGIHEPSQVDAPSSPSPAAEHTIADLDPGLVYSYQVNRVVTDFPDVEDLSTPEAAYATINRASARGDEGIWRRVTGRPEIKDLMPPADAPAREVPPEVARVRLGSHIEEVWVYRGGARCAVFAEQKVTSPPGAVHYDIRSLTLVDGQWLNTGNTAAPTLEIARSIFAEGCVYDDALREAYREAMEQPESILRMATLLFKRLRSADYDYYLNTTDREMWKEFLYPGYTVERDRPGWMNWVCTTFRENPIAEVELGEALLGEYGRPTVPYRLTLEDGSVLDGGLAFMYVPDTNDGCRTGNWSAMEGLDWHLRDPS